MVRFKSPIDIKVHPEPWISITTEFSTKPTDKSTSIVTARVAYPDGYTFDSNKHKLNFTINDNLTDQPDLHIESVEPCADNVPSGTVQASCAAAPDTTLASSTV